MNQRIKRASERATKIELIRAAMARVRPETIDRFYEDKGKVELLFSRVEAERGRWE
jgi:hypothetical protein